MASARPFVPHPRPWCPPSPCAAEVTAAGVSTPMVNTSEQNQPQTSLFLTLSPVRSGPVCFKGLQDSLVLLGGHREGPRLSVEAVFYTCLQTLLNNCFVAWKGNGKPYQGLKCCFMGLWVDLTGSASAGTAKPRALPWEVSTEKLWLA